MTITTLTQLHKELVRERDELYIRATRRANTGRERDERDAGRQQAYAHAAELVSELIATVTKARDEAGRDRDDPELTLDTKSQGFYNAQTYARILGEDNG